MLLAFILGPLMEEYLRRAMLLSRGNPWVFVTRPISATLLVLAGLAMCAVLLPAFGRTRKERSRAAPPERACRALGLRAPPLQDRLAFEDVRPRGRRGRSDGGRSASPRSGTSR
jgi:hypothetical protein